MADIRFTKNDRQAIIDDYLNKTGRNSYVPSEFIQWLRDTPDHKVYDTFFGTSDAEMADKHREVIARSFASGLRITIKVSELPMPQNTDSIKVETVTVPSMVSPINNRANGGGYIAVDVQDTNTMQELCRQAYRDLNAWKNRFEGVCNLSGIDTESIDSILKQLELKSVVDDVA